jgi:hypothetical protein
MLRKANNVFSVLVDDVTNSTLPAAGSVVTAANIGNGAVCLVDLGLNRLDAAAFTALGNADKFMLVQGRGTGQPLMKSGAITKGTYSTSISKHKPAVQQVTTIGYNGTTGSLPAANDTSYYVKIRKNDNDAGNRSQPFSLFGQFKTDGSATQEEVAEGLALNLVKNFSDEAPITNGYLSVDILMDEAGVVATGTTTVFGVTNGSSVVTIDGTLTLPVVGDYIRFATGLTVGVYKVTAYTASSSITLDRPYTGATDAAVAIAGTRVVANATAIAAEFGIVLTGVAADFDVNKFRNYFANRFTATFSDEDTLVTATTGARNGSGVWQAVAMDEYMSYGFEGQNDMLATPATYRDQTVKIPGIGGATALSSRYSTLNISWTENITGLVSQSGAQGSVIFHVNLGTQDPLGLLAASGSSGELLVEAMGLTDTDFNMV